MEDVYREVQRAAGLGLSLNLLLGLVKLVSGIVGQSFALVADAINSLGDVVSTLIVLFALRVAQRPADPEHPYGHSRAEGIAASNVAVLIVVSALMLAVEAFSRMTLKHELPPTWTLWIAAANILVKEWLYRHNRAVGERTGSAAMIANAWDHRSDALCGIAVLIGLVVVRLGGPAWIWADEVASLIVAVAIGFSGMQLFISSAENLMDTQAHSEMIEQMTAQALQVDGVRNVETLWVRKSGLEYFADIHIEVDANLSIEVGHEIGHRVKAKLVEEFVALRDVLVHLEPFPHLHPADSPAGNTMPATES